MTSIFNLKPGASTGGSSKKQLSPGKYDAVVHAVIDLGAHETFYQGQSTGVRSMVKFLFEVPSETNDDGSTVIKGLKDLKVSDHERSDVMKILMQLLEADSIDAVSKKISECGGPTKAMGSLIGKAVSFTVKSFTNKEGLELSYLDKNSIVALDPRLPQPEAQQEGFVFNVNADDAADVFKNKLSKFTQDKIMTAVDCDSFPASLQQAFVQVQEDSAEDRILG